MLEAVHVGYAVGRKWLIEGIDVAFAPGRLTVIIGPNGAGKSTLLRLLTGELKPTTGRVMLGARDVGRMAPAELSRLRAVVPQHTLLAFPFTVIEVVELGVTVPGLMSQGARSRRLADDMLARVGLSDFAERDYSHLSGGERQRVHIGRALCQIEASPPGDHASVLLVDEPTSSLDIAHQLEVLEELKAQAAKGRIVVAVLHDLNLSAAYADDLLLLASARQRAFGAPHSVLTDDLLSSAYRCGVRLNTVPEPERPFHLPQACVAHFGCAPVRRSESAA